MEVFQMWPCKMLAVQVFIAQKKWAIHLFSIKQHRMYMYIDIDVALTSY